DNPKERRENTRETLFSGSRLKVRSKNGATRRSDIEHVAIGNRAGRRQRSEGSRRKHRAGRVINVKSPGEHMSQRGQRASLNGGNGISDIEGKAATGSSEGATYRTS